jgi:hypothetical protein
VLLGAKRLRERRRRSEQKYQEGAHAGIL